MHRGTETCYQRHAMLDPETIQLSAMIDRIFDECENDRIVHGHTWGKWRLDATNLKLVRSGQIPAGT